MNPVLPTSGDRLALLYHLSQTFNSSLDLSEVLNRVLDEVIVAIHAERGFVMLVEPGPGRAEERLAFRVARGMDQTTIDEPRFQISRSVVERAALEGQPILTSNAQSDARFSMRTSVMILGLRSILCVPLKIHERVLGVIYVDNRIQEGIFTQADLELLSAIASSAAIAIENARLYQLAVEQGRLEQELRMARQVQANLLPRQTPQAPGWEFAALWQPARQVAGDYYDFIPGEGGQLGLVIADVTDKGMPAALFMALTRSTIRASLDRAASPAEGINRANRLLCADSASSGMFVTLFFAALNPASGLLTYVNAGQNPPLLYSARQKQLTRLSRTGMALGVSEDALLTQQEAQLEPGDFILLYTDGLTDALDAQEQEFGMERLEQTLLAQYEAPASELAAAVSEAVLDFAGANSPFDDITLVVAKRTGT